MTIEIHNNSPEGKILASYKLEKLAGENSSDLYEFDLPVQESAASLCFVFRGKKKNLLVFDSFSFK